MNSLDSFAFSTGKNVNFIFSGAPGSGKTTTGNYLRDHGNCQIIEEAATVIIREYRQKALDHHKDLANFQRRVEELCTKDLELPRLGISIFDRCNLDNIVYKKHYNPGAVVNSETTTQVITALRDHGVSNHVFLFDLSEKEEDYVQDDVRTETYANAKILQAKFSQEYEEAGFHVHHIPWMPLQERAARVFQEMEDVAASTLERQPLTDLYKFAKGMNDEGGRLQELLQSGQVFSNLSVVLDRPFVDGIDFDHLRIEKSRMGYSIKEEAIDCLNEHQVNLAYASIMQYYITQGHGIVSKAKTEPLKIVLHSFHGSDGPGHLKVLNHLLDLCCPEFEKVQFERDSSFTTVEFCYHLPNENVTLFFSKGKVDKNPEENVYDDFRKSAFLKQADIVLTFSTHVGLSPEWPAGSFCVPIEWTPINIDRMEINKKARYSGGNHLALCIKEIVAGEGQKVCANRINQVFRSKNVSKQEQKAIPLQVEDFHITEFLELGGHIFIPNKEKRSTFKLSEY